VQIHFGMPAARNNGLTRVGIILYGFLAGCAATTVIGLLPFLVGLAAAGIFNYLGWEYAGNPAARFGFYYVYSVPIQMHSL
jgi:hypothetical protein